VGSSAPTGGPPHGKRAALTGVSSDQNLLDMSITNAVRGLRGPKYENWPLGDPRAVAPWRLGCFFKSSASEKRAVPRPSGAAPEDVVGMAEPPPLFSGGGRGAPCV
jgi:hypothetical protein